MIAADQITKDVTAVIQELAQAGGLGSGQVLVIGTSTSEVVGQQIGSAGAEEIAAAIFVGIERCRKVYGFVPAFQCCEHLNRALVLERAAAERYAWEEVAAVPVPKAGGSMAAYAYRHLASPVLVETLQAHAGIDIGDTFIGMHLRRVAVPFRPTVKQIGLAHVTTAYTRPKLIGGARAIYHLEQEEGQCE